MLTLDERINDDGAGQKVTLDVDEGRLAIRVGDGAPAYLPVEALDRVMARYGKPLADGIMLEGPSLEIACAGTLHRIRHRARYDVIARDFLVWTRPGEDPLVELATSISAALLHLAKAGEGSE
jgi:hypothetical protein